MDTRAQVLKHMLGTVDSEYVMAAQTAAQAAERRLTELEDRDARREAREAATARDAASHYPILTKE
jgi:hypothetical protein